MKILHWIRAFRLRTLFLSLSCIWAGLICAQSSGKFNLNIAVFTMLTAVFLQILSNLANDYGDSIHGADHLERKGPKREVQSGTITKSMMKKAIVFFGFLSFASGCLLLYFAYFIIGTLPVVVLFLLGLLSIAAAIFYTNGKKPYGYAGLGDISVFVFFGMVGILGTEYLQIGYLTNSSYSLGIALGCLSVGVLNLNNMRDIDSDKIAGKKSIPVRIGQKNAKIYHAILLLMALGCMLNYCYSLLLPITASLGILVILSLNLFLAIRVKEQQNFDPLLKWLSLSTLAIVIILQASL